MEKKERSQAKRVIGKCINTFEKYKEFKNKLEKRDLVLGKGINWQLYTQKPLPAVVQKDKILEHHGNYVGTFIEV